MQIHAANIKMQFKLFISCFAGMLEHVVFRLLLMKREAEARFKWSTITML